jgi:hypothetical protein
MASIAAAWSPAERNAKSGSCCTVIPIAARIARTMIWTTAKSTEVNRRHRPRPRRASGLVGSPALAAAPEPVAARMAVGVAMIGS